MKSGFDELRRMIEDAVNNERERCAQIVESNSKNIGDGMKVAKLIRNQPKFKLS